MVEFPHIFGKRRVLYHQPGNGMASTGHPAIVIDSSVAEHLEILRGMSGPGIGIVKSIEKRSSIERPLFGSVDHFRERKTGGFKRGRCDIGYMRKLRTNFTLGFDPLGPMHDHAIARSAKMRCDLLRPLERSVACPGPADRVMGKSNGAAPFIDVRHVDCGITDDAV